MRMMRRLRRKAFCEFDPPFLQNPTGAIPDVALSEQKTTDGTRWNCLLACLELFVLNAPPLEHLGYLLRRYLEP